MMRTTLAFVLICVVAACGPGGRDQGTCNAGDMSCNGTELQTCTNGHFEDTQQCPMACSPTLGCTTCVPGTGTCNGNISHACNADGSGYVDYTCDPVQGETCDAMSGVCTGPCAAQALGQSYIGCEYYPTVTGNVVGDAFDFAVAIANASGTPAMVTIEGGALTTPMTVMVPGNNLVVQKLPWQQALKMCNAADTPELPGCSGATMPSPGIVPKGAYHLRSDTPITVYQFNALEYAISNGTDFSFSNDASLMLPTNVWRNDYFVAAYPGIGQYPSLLAITATADNTMVTINSKSAAPAGGGVPALAIGTPTAIMLNAGDAVEVATITGDFTGSEVTSSAPVEVIGGHFCTTVDVGACDHLEESMFGVDTLSSTYIVNAPLAASTPTANMEKVRIIATQANTTLTFDPPQAGAATTIANIGGFVEIENSNSFMVTASAKVLVAQYMEGDDEGEGDPSLELAVPVEQFRTSYLFNAPISYDSNYVDVTAPTGATVMVDGTIPVTLTNIGTTGYALGRVLNLGAGPNNDGSHNITGSGPFGITVYGYGQYTSYWYAGGLNLTTVID